MSETTVTILVTVITALGSIITGLFGWLARKGVNFVDAKTKLLDETHERERKDTIKQRIVDAVTLTARATMQTYVDEIKKKRADGKLTKEESAEALRRTADQALGLLKEEGVQIGREALGVVVEAVVGKLKVEQKNGLRGEVKAG